MEVGGSTKNRRPGSGPYTRRILNGKDSLGWQVSSNSEGLPPVDKITQVFVEVKSSYEA